MEIAIIGGGIGGLTTALALKKAGVSFKVYESTSVLKPVGAGIIIANNAMQVFRHLDIHQEVMDRGNRISVMNITKPGFDVLSRVELKTFEKQYGLSNYAIHRAELHQILLEAVGKENIVLNKRLREVERKGTNYFTLYFEDESSTDVKYLIGADGIKSKVRKSLFAKSELRNAGQLCWRGMLHFELDESYRHEALEAWGKGKRFGFVKISSEQVYWYLLVDSDIAKPDDDLKQYVQDFHPLVLKLVSATSPEKIISAELHDLKPISLWSESHVCLMGDAAHATTPNLGQGACQAIEDAYILGELLKQYSISEAFEKYPDIRMKKARAVVDMSWIVGKIAHLRNPLAVSLRDFVMKSTPRKINLKQMERLFKLDMVD